MLSWGLAGASAGFLRLALERSRTLLVGFGFAWGFVFGAIMDVYQLASFGPVFTWQAFVVTHARGIPFDLAHAVTNAVLLGVAGPALIRLLRRHDRRLHVELSPTHPLMRRLRFPSPPARSSPRPRPPRRCRHPRCHSKTNLSSAAT